MRTFTGMALAALPRLCVGVLIATAGCNKKSLQELDASAGGIGGIDAGGIGFGDGGAGVGDVGGGGGAVDRPPLDAPFEGRRSFIVTADVSATDSTTTTVTSHVFTMTLDTRERIAVIGVPGGSAVWPVEETTAGLRLAGPLSFGVAVSASCGGSLAYDAIEFTVHASGGLSGTGRGVLVAYEGTTVADSAATSILSGVPDAEPPTLSLSAGGDVADPWTPIGIVASEPLPPQTVPPTLRSKSGDVITLYAETVPSPFVTGFSKPPQLLRFGEEYQVTFEGITDLAGNALRPSAPPTFTTRAAPPLIAGDGFESVTEATLGGAQVLSGAGAPVLAGARSLYIPPAASLGPSGRQTQLAVRLSVASGQKFVRFDFQTVNPVEATISWLVASVGGQIETATLATDVGSPTTPATIDGAPVSLGPKRSAEILLRPDARSGEVLVTRIATQGGRCGFPPPPPVPGIIIDNLRTE